MHLLERKEAAKCGGAAMAGTEKALQARGLAALTQHGYTAASDHRKDGYPVGSQEPRRFMRGRRIGA